MKNLLECFPILQRRNSNWKIDSRQWLYCLGVLRRRVDLRTWWSQNTDITSPRRPSQHHPYWTTVTSRQFFYDYDLLDLTKSPSSSKLFTPNLAWLTEAFGLEFNRGTPALLIEINVHEHFIPCRPNVFVEVWMINQWLVSKCSEIYYRGDKHQSSTDLDCPGKTIMRRIWDCDVMWDPKHINISCCLMK